MSKWETLGVTMLTKSMRSSAGSAASAAAISWYES